MGGVPVRGILRVSPPNELPSFSSRLSSAELQGTRKKAFLQRTLSADRPSLLICLPSFPPCPVGFHQARELDSVERPQTWAAQDGEPQGPSHREGTRHEASFEHSGNHPSQGFHPSLPQRWCHLYFASSQTKAPPLSLLVKRDKVSHFPKVVIAVKSSHLHTRGSSPLSTPSPCPSFFLGSTNSQDSANASSAVSRPPAISNCPLQHPP